MHRLDWAIWGHIWKHTVGKRQTNAASVNLHPLGLAIWGHIWKHTVENGRKNATDDYFASYRAGNLRSHLKTHSGEKLRKCKQCDYASSRIVNCCFSGRRFEDTFENTQWRKVRKMQPMWLCILPGRRFEDTFENAHWGKVKQMQPMWLCLISCKWFEDTFENTQWRKIK